MICARLVDCAGVVPLKLTGILNIAYENKTTAWTVTVLSFDAV
jgi:hypothetical protein